MPPSADDLKIEELGSGEEEYDSDEEDDGIGFRVFCDVSQATITFGDWYHKKGEDFDLCEKEYQKLSDAEKEQFVKVDTPEDLGQDLGEYVGDEDDLEDMSPEQILEMISEAFMLKEGRPPTEEEAAAFLKMIDEASGEEDDDNSDGWLTDEGEDDSDDDGAGVGPMFVPDSNWSVRDLKAFIKDHGGSVAGLSEKSELLELAQSLAKPTAAQADGKPAFGAPGAFSFSLPGSDATPAPAPAGAFSFSLPGTPAPAPAPGSGAFAFKFAPTGGAPAPAPGAGKFNFNVGQSAEALAASQSTAAPAGGFGGFGALAAAATLAPASSAASVAPAGGASALPTEALPESEYERQARVLTKYYGKHDPSKDEAACRAILDKRRKAAPHLHEVAWKDLCTKLAAKYGGEDPEALSAAAPATATTAATGSDSAKAEAEAAKATRLAKIEGTPDGQNPTDDGGGSSGHASLERQVQTLARFYAKYDPVSQPALPHPRPRDLTLALRQSILPNCCHNPSEPERRKRARVRGIICLSSRFSRSRCWKSCSWPPVARG